MNRLAWVFLAFWLAGVADYLIQSLYFGWPTMGIPNASTGQHLVWWLDWLPRDPYHIYQAARNLLWLTGAASSAYILRDRPWWVIMAVTIGLYVLARGLSSSLILQIVR